MHWRRCAASSRRPACRIRRWASLHVRMNVRFGMLLRKDLAWALLCLAEKEVVLNGREEEQLELAITPGAVGLTRADPNVPRSVQAVVVQ